MIPSGLYNLPVWLRAPRVSGDDPLPADIPGVYFRLVDSKSKQRDLQLQILAHRGGHSPDFQKGIVA